MVLCVNQFFSFLSLFFTYFLYSILSVVFLCYEPCYFTITNSFPVPYPNSNYTDCLPSFEASGNSDSVLLSVNHHQSQDHLSRTENRAYMHPSDSYFPSRHSRLSSMPVIVPILSPRLFRRLPSAPHAVRLIAIAQRLHFYSGTPPRPTDLPAW